MWGGGEHATILIGGIVHRNKVGVGKEIRAGGR